MQAFLREIFRSPPGVMPTVAETAVRPIRSCRMFNRSKLNQERLLQSCLMRLGRLAEGRDMVTMHDSCLLPDDFAWLDLPLCILLPRICDKPTPKIYRNPLKPKPENPKPVKTQTRKPQVLLTPETQSPPKRPKKAQARHSVRQRLPLQSWEKARGRSTQRKAFGV